MSTCRIFFLPFFCYNVQTSKYIQQVPARARMWILKKPYILSRHSRSSYDPPLRLRRPTNRQKVELLRRIGPTFSRTNATLVVSIIPVCCESWRPHQRRLDIVELSQYWTNWHGSAAIVFRPDERSEGQSRDYSFEVGRVNRVHFWLSSDQGSSCNAIPEAKQSSKIPSITIIFCSFSNFNFYNDSTCISTY